MLILGVDYIVDLLSGFINTLALIWGNFTNFLYNIRFSNFKVLRLESNKVSRHLQYCVVI